MARRRQASNAAHAMLAQQLDRAQRLANAGSWVWDIVSNDLVWSDQLFRIFGLSQDVFAPTYPGFLERVHPDERALVAQRIQRAIEGAEAYTLDYRIILPDGSVRIIHEQGVVDCDPSGQALRMLGAALDITPLRAAETAARRSQELLASMLKISPEAIMITDLAARILLFSAGAEAMFGYSAEEAIGLTAEHLIPARFRKGHKGHVRGFAAAARPTLRMHERSEIFGLRRNGEEFPAEASVSRLETADGFAFTTIVRDLSAWKSSELQLIGAREQAEQANLAKSTFLANMSHEIRTPLNGVVGIAGALARTELSTKQSEMVQLIETSGRALEGLLGDILDLAKVDGGHISVRAEPFDLNAVVQDTFALFRARAADKGVGFTMSIAEEARGHFRGDDLKIRQILSNLLSNAVKFTDQGEVRLFVVAPMCGEEGCRIRFVVEDTGIGFAPGIARRLFARFEQADSSITRQFGGAGLGLAISKSLVELMGGAISASSTPGRGSTFMFELQLPRSAIEAAADTVSSQAAAPLTTGPIRILLAEDHVVNRRVVELILDTLPVELTSVENGSEAVAAAEAQAFDLIFMDMQMPVMDGLTAIRLIRAREAAGEGASVPICVLTANAMPAHREEAEVAGADAFLTKPVDACELISLVLEIAAGRSEVAEIAGVSRPALRRSGAPALAGALRRAGRRWPAAPGVPILL